mmetsp:Transcript_20590/g.58357  ORF Transcript_20590/g.58357 Transcript_20590/m.58357 type:complete len:350 (-) Transcript_20590:395-1444(-)
MKKNPVKKRRKKRKKKRTKKMETGLMEDAMQAGMRPATMMKPSVPSMSTAKVDLAMDARLRRFEVTIADLAVSTRDEVFVETRSTPDATRYIHDPDTRSAAIPFTLDAVCEEEWTTPRPSSRDNHSKVCLRPSSHFQEKSNSWTMKTKKKILMARTTTPSLMTPIESPMTMPAVSDPVRRPAGPRDDPWSRGLGTAVIPDGPDKHLLRPQPAGLQEAKSPVVHEARQSLGRSTFRETNSKTKRMPMSRPICSLSRISKLSIPMEKRESTRAPSASQPACPMERDVLNTKKKAAGMKEIGFMDDGPDMVVYRMAMVTFMKVASRMITSMERVSCDLRTEGSLKANTFADK